MKRVTVLLSTGGRLSTELPDDVAANVPNLLAESDARFLGMPDSDGRINAKHLVLVNVAHVIRVDIEDIG